MGGSGRHGANADEYGVHLGVALKGDAEDLRALARNAEAASDYHDAHLLRGIADDVERGGSLLIGAKADAATEEDV